MEEIKTIPYNEFLYQKRKELKFSKIKMAKCLHMTYIRYHLLESGYIKPTKKIIDKVSNYFNVNYKDYYIDDLTYPKEIQDKKSRKIVVYTYHILSKLWFRLLALALTILSIGSWITFINLDRSYEKVPAKFYSPEIITLRDEIISNGSITFSIVDEMLYPRISEMITISESEEMLVTISTKYNENTCDIKFNIVIWTDLYRFDINLYNIDEDNTIYYSIDCLWYQDSNRQYFEAPLDYYYFYNPTDAGEYLVNIDNEYGISEQFKNLINEKLGYEIEDIESEIFIPYLTEKNNIEHKQFKYFIIKIFSMLLSAFFGFITFYSFVYGKRMNIEKEYSHSDKLLYLDIASNIKKEDIKFHPFIPEIIFQLFGIFLISIGVTRVVYLSQMAVNYQEESRQIANELLSIQMIGIFILSFIKFDLFIDDARVIRNIFLYPLVFYIVYYFETLLIVNIQDMGSLLSMFLNFSLPNPFMSTTCYFLIMFFLFYTPKIIKTRNKLLLFRLASILPVIYIIVSFLIFNSDILFGIKLDPWTKYFFSGQRLGLSILAVSYLFCLFFLRLYFKKKYGEDNANRYFMGNRFLFLKNIMTSVIIIIIWFIELLCMENPTLNKMGIGINFYMIILVPLILFYHPHKGKRNRITDYLILGLYITVLLVAYLVAAIVVALSLI